jgi:hypothetical protein
VLGRYVEEFCAGLAAQERRRGFDGQLLDRRTNNFANETFELLAVREVFG